MAVTENKHRIGNFTSSKISALCTSGQQEMGFGKPAITYINEKKMERKLKRSIDTEASSRPMLWGKFLEPRVHQLLGTEYEHVFDESIVHPTIKTWSGSPDFRIATKKVISDSKCPQPKAFATLVDNCTKGIETFKKEHDDYYWQLVSNAAITGSEWIELIVYMPYESELHDIRWSVENSDLEEPWKYRFITECDKSELAYLPDDSDYENLNVFRFPVNMKDIEFLTNQVKKASQLLLI